MSCSRAIPPLMWTFSPISRKNLFSLILLNLDVLLLLLCPLILLPLLASAGTTGSMGRRPLTAASPARTQKTSSLTGGSSHLTCWVLVFLSLPLTLSLRSAVIFCFFYRIFSPTVSSWLTLVPLSPCSQGPSLSPPTGFVSSQLTVLKCFVAVQR